MHHARRLLLMTLAIVAWVGPAEASKQTRAPKARSAKKGGVAPERKRVVQPGETLITILSQHGQTVAEALRWDEAMRRAAGEFTLSPGHVLRLAFRAKRLERLSYEVDDCVRVVVSRHGKELRGKTEPLQARVRFVGAEGVVTKTFFQAARQSGIPDPVISQMADVLGWEFDLRRVRNGDRFRVLYEQRTSPDGRKLPPGKLLAAEIRSGKRVVQAFYYDDGGQGIYVDGRGQTISRPFLRYPVEFTRITSHFSRNRLHPVLQVNRPHFGVDFAAPAGSPVRAAGEGVVTRAGWDKDYGNQIELKHENGWTTQYAHLKGIARHLRPGVRVQQGEVIGWVGQTGLATGPHLHFALFRNGQYQNPLTAKVELRRQVRDPRRFAQAKSLLLRQISTLTRPAVPLHPVLVASLPVPQHPQPVTLTQ